MTLEARLAQGVERLGVELPPRAQQKMLDYAALLKKWNRVYNLTAVRDPGRVVSNHFLDCLAILPHLWPRRWLDVGSGAGLPGVVLALAKPDWAFVLLDSNSKKTSFIQQAAIELELQNVEVVCARAEIWQSAEKFDGIISRAFAESAVLIERTRHLLSEKGRWVAMKASAEAELSRLPSDISIMSKVALQIPGVDGVRSLVILERKER